MIDEHTIVDADRLHFDIGRVLRYWKCNEEVKDDETKTDIMHIMTDAIAKIAQFNVNLNVAMEGLIQYALVGPTYLLDPYRRSEAAANIKQRKLRTQYLKLMLLLEREQLKHDKRELRRIKNLRQI